MDNYKAEAPSGSDTGDNHPTNKSEMSAQKQGFPTSLFTAQQPNRLSKRFTLGEGGELVKESGGNLIEGYVETIFFNSMDEFAARLMNLTPANAITYGVCGYKKAKVITAKRLKQLKKDPAFAKRGDQPMIARNRDHFEFAAGPAILMVDYDPPHGCTPLGRAEFLQLLYGACPKLKYAPHVVADSASSHIYNGEKQIRGAGGLRVFALVHDGQDIQRAGEALYKHLWLIGHGYIAISSAGTMLPRTLVDGSVWQPERLDFVGGAACVAPLEQKKPPPQVFNNEMDPLDTRSALPSLKSYEEKEYAKLVAKAKQEAEPEAKSVREEWVNARVKEALKGFGGGDDERVRLANTIRRTYEDAAADNKLLGDFVLYPETGGTATVDELLRNPSKWHGKRFAAPLEPEYRGDTRIAKAFLKETNLPSIFSYAHGGQRFTLHNQRVEIVAVNGERNRICQEALVALKQDGSIFAHGGEMVRVTHAGEIVPLDLDGIQIRLDKLILWTKPGGMKDGTPKPNISIDCPPSIAKGILAMKRDQWGLPDLKAVIKAPTMEPKTGRLIEKEGYDEGTGLLLICDNLDQWPGVPDKPTQKEVRNAFVKLWKPFKKFPFNGPASVGVFLAAILTAIIRAALETAPGFLITSPVPGSGKSLLSTALSTLSGQIIPKVFPVSESQEEIKKLLLAIGRVGGPAVIFDNIEKEFGSSAVCAWLTAEVYSDRMLKVSQTITVPTRLLLLLNGNNVILKGDICRRVLTCEIDPGVEEPWRRKFDLDPLQYCKDNHLEMIAAGLTLLRAGMQMGEKPGDRTASFEDWSDIVRPAVLLILGQKLMDVADPVDSIQSAFQLDPGRNDLSDVLNAWYTAFLDEGKTLAEVIAYAENEDREERKTLFEALSNVAGDRGTINARKLGHWISRYRGVLVDGLSFEACGERNKVNLWRVKPKDEG